MPPRCIDCGELSSEYDSLCSSCWKKYKFIEEPSCKICGTPFEIEIDSICLGCLKDKPKYDISKSLFKFDENSKKLIHNFKYYDKTHLSKFFSKIIYYKYRDIINTADLVIPVPMHKLKRILRLYNQAHILAKDISILANIPLDPKSLKKVKYTKSQTFLTKSERSKNLVNTIIVENNELIKGKKILLVDDVITTGETINNCAKVLKKNGASKVIILSIAKTYN